MHSSLTTEEKRKYFKKHSGDLKLYATALAQYEMLLLQYKDEEEKRLVQQNELVEKSDSMMKILNDRAAEINKKIIDLNALVVDKVPKVLKNEVTERMLKKKKANDPEEIAKAISAKLVSLGLINREEQSSYIKGKKQNVIMKTSEQRKNLIDLFPNLLDYYKEKDEGIYNEAITNPDIKKLRDEIGQQVKNFSEMMAEQIELDGRFRKFDTETNIIFAKHRQDCNERSGLTKQNGIINAHLIHAFRTEIEENIINSQRASKGYFIASQLPDPEILKKKYSYARIFIDAKPPEVFYINGSGKPKKLDVDAKKLQGLMKQALETMIAENDKKIEEIRKRPPSEKIILPTDYVDYDNNNQKHKDFNQLSRDKELGDYNEEILIYNEEILILRKKAVSLDSSTGKKIEEIEKEIEEIKEKIKDIDKHYPLKQIPENYPFVKYDENNPEHVKEHERLKTQEIKFHRKEIRELRKGAPLSSIPVQMVSACNEVILTNLIKPDEKIEDDLKRNRPWLLEYMGEKKIRFPTYELNEFYDANKRLLSDDNKRLLSDKTMYALLAASDPNKKVDELKEVFMKIIKADEKLMSKGKCLISEESILKLAEQMFKQAKYRKILGPIVCEYVDGFTQIKKGFSPTSTTEKVEEISRFLNKLKNDDDDKDLEKLDKLLKGCNITLPIKERKEIIQKSIEFNNNKQSSSKAGPVNDAIPKSSAAQLWAQRVEQPQSKGEVSAQNPLSNLTSGGSIQLNSPSQNITSNINPVNSCKTASEIVGQDIYRNVTILGVPPTNPAKK